MELKSVLFSLIKRLLNENDSYKITLREMLREELYLLPLTKI